MTNVIHRPPKSNTPQAPQPTSEIYDAVLTGAGILWAAADEVHEVRLFTGKRFGDKAEVYSGFFSSPELAAQAVVKFGDAYEACYITLNPVQPELIARCCNRLAKADSGRATGDAQIIRRNGFFVDLDPVRVAGISSSDSEKEEALEATYRVREFFRQYLPDPVLADSGNGYHLIYRYELPNDPESTEKVQALLAAAAEAALGFNAKVDLSVFKPPGSLSCTDQWLAKGKISRVCLELHPDRTDGLA